MKVFHVSWNDPETVFHEMPWKKNFTISLYRPEKNGPEKTFDLMHIVDMSKWTHMLSYNFNLFLNFRDLKF